MRQTQLGQVVAVTFTREVRRVSNRMDSRATRADGIIPTAICRGALSGDGTPSAQTVPVPQASARPLRPVGGTVSPPFCGGLYDYTL